VPRSSRRSCGRCAPPRTGPCARGFFLDLLRRGFSAEEARRQLDIAIDWGHYGELFEYDAESGQLVLGSDPAKVGA